jgi:hypothetical protein
MEFTNLYLVSQVERLGEGRAAIKERYLVINLWHYYPSPGVKTCHVWTIWDGELNPARSRATFRLLVEDFNNTFLGERQGRLDGPTIDRLTEFYGRARAFLSKGARSFPLAGQSPERDAIALRNRSCRVPFFTHLPCLASPRVSDAQRCLCSAASLT